MKSKQKSKDVQNHHHHHHEYALKTTDGMHRSGSVWSWYVVSNRSLHVRSAEEKSRCLGHKGRVCFLASEWFLFSCAKTEGDRWVVHNVVFLLCHCASSWWFSVNVFLWVWVCVVVCLWFECFFTTPPSRPVPTVRPVGRLRVQVLSWGVFTCPPEGLEELLSSWLRSRRRSRSHYRSVLLNNTPVEIINLL